MVSLILRSISGALLRMPPLKTKSATMSILLIIIPKRSTSWYQVKPNRKLIHEAVEAEVGVVEVVEEEVDSCQKLMNRMNQKPKKIPLRHAKAQVKEAQIGVSEAAHVAAEDKIKVSTNTNELAWMAKDKNNMILCLLRNSEILKKMIS